MKNIGKVIEIFSASKDSSGLPRPKVERLNLIKDFGIENDKFAGKKLDQTVMIVGIKSYEIARENNVDLKIGSLGENILLDFDPHDFSVDDIFHIGDTQVQITQICTVCNHLSVFSKELPFLLKNHRGLYCKILNGGIILKDSIVKIKG
jgi:MOSC domain-containing protein YiiM